MVVKTGPKSNIMERIDCLARISEMPEYLTRRYLTKEHRQANHQVGVWMGKAGMRVHEDAVGNIIGRYEGETQGRPALIIGSHLDSVVMAGKYDGPLGVLTGISVVQSLNDRGIRLPIAIEVIGFADEEGVRFKSTYLGSRAVAGTFDIELFATRDSDGISMREAFLDFGLNPDRIKSAVRRREELIGYVELHIEQGPVLEERGVSVGVVSAISGATRLKVWLKGEAGHAGTVPMGLRKDALISASECVLKIEKLARDCKDAVATVGQFAVKPGATNVIPGLVEFTIDVRVPTDRERQNLVSKITAELDKIVRSHQMEINFELVHEAESRECSPKLVGIIEEGIRDLGLPIINLPSGAGHDAAAMADLTPMGMIFLRCEGGVSHNPNESITEQDALVGIELLSKVVSGIAAEYS